MINGVPRILIIRLSAIGDVVRVLPALHMLRDAFPNAQIDWAIEPKSAGIVEGHPCLDEVVLFERQPGFVDSTKNFLRFCRKIRRSAYDIVIDFHGVFKSGLVMGWSGAAARHGFSPPRAQEASWLFSNRRAKLPSKNLNRVEENLILCQTVCPRRHADGVTIYVPPDVEDEVDAYLEDTFDGGKLLVAMHAPVDRPEKQWPLENYAELADLLLADGRFEVLLTWGPGQEAQAEAVAAKAKRAPVVAPETADLKHLVWLLDRADLYCGGDTGPMHIAAAMDTPVVAIFGGTAPAKHAPYRRACEVLYADEEKRIDPAERLRRITPNMAYDACIRLLVQ